MKVDQNDSKFATYLRYGYQSQKSLNLIKHYLIFKRGSLCEICRKKTVEQMHHCDRDRYNNREANLVLLCGDCHRSIHQRMKATKANPFHNFVRSR